MGWVLHVRHSLLTTSPGEGPNRLRITTKVPTQAGIQPKLIHTRILVMKTQLI